MQLHEIGMRRCGTLGRDRREGKRKTQCDVLSSCLLDFAWRSQRIVAIPPSPKKKNYNITENPIVWLPEARQKAVIEAMPLEDQPISWRLKYTLRRPCEAFSLHKVDFDGEQWTVHRSVCAQLIDRTKTGEIHDVPLLDELIPYLVSKSRSNTNWGLFRPTSS